MPTCLEVDVADHVATVTLTNRAMAPTLITEIGDTFRKLSADAELRAAVVRSNQKPFTYGLDLMRAFRDLGPLITGAKLAGPRTELLRLIRRWQDSFDAVARCPVPVIAAVHGWCIGAGVDLITACDIRLASEDAQFSVRETRMAIVADLGTLQRLPAIVGQGHARELAFVGGDIGAQRAAEIGLVNHLYADRDALWAAADTMAREIADNAPLAVRGVKDVLRFGEGGRIGDGMAYVAAWNAAFLASKDLGEAMAAYANKRKPMFKGE